MREVLKKLLESRFKISTQLYLGIGFIVTIALVSAAISWQSFRRVGEAQKNVSEDSVPELVNAFAIARRSASLVDAAPRLLAVATTDDLSRVIIAINLERELFEMELSVLMREGLESSTQQHFSRIQSRAEALISNVEEIKDTVSFQLRLKGISDRQQRQLLAVRTNIEQTLIPAIDDQFYFTVTGYRDLGEKTAPLEQYRSEEELSQYRRLSELQEAVNLGVTVLTNTLNVSSVPLLEPNLERFEAILDAIERNKKALGASEELLNKIGTELDNLLELGSGQESIFRVHTKEIELTARQENLLTQNRTLALELISEVESIVETARLKADQASEISTRTVTTGGRTLLLLSALSLISAFLVGWLFVGRFLARRLKLLSGRMQQMAGGDLMEEVHLPGRDEIAHMASALEIFRKNSLEALRVDRAEKLAKELSSKNSELEHVLGELKRVQDQIVMREKLAALGELTAGVAHEIKNPLNFIKNFSEATIELVDELNEALEEASGAFNEEQKGYVEEISQDLKGNAQRIKDHAERANRIVHDMLSMGRGGGKHQPSDINVLLDEHARLAFHSARSSDSDFQLEIVHDFDDSIGKVEVIPQDVGRLFLNLVGNGCYATDKQRRKLVKEHLAKKGIEIDEDANQEEREKRPEDVRNAEVGAKKAVFKKYQPTLTLTTKKLDEHVEIAIRDNGCGISEENIAKIFNPFFTTKPTDKGTGLGLALSSDIIRAHGGTISVKSELEKFTELTVSIPLVPPEELSELEEQDSAAAKS